MSTHILQGNRNTTWVLRSHNEEWIVADNAQISVNGQHGIYASPHYSGNILRVQGEIDVNGANMAGVLMGGSKSKVAIEDGAYVDATDAAFGIRMMGQYSAVKNEGVIEAEHIGVSLWAKSTLVNDNQITGATGVDLEGIDGLIVNNGTITGSEKAIEAAADGAEIQNNVGGVIEGEYVGINLIGTGKARVVNDGSIFGGEFALVDQGGAMQFFNNGQIVGDVDLGGGNDLFDTRNGTVEGVVRGGSGNDTYRISSGDVNLSEALAGGTDTVESSVSYQLNSGFEILKLTGTDNIGGQGNQAANRLIGNGGDNKLSGLGGSDVIDGGVGDDLLTGGTAADMFVFGAGRGTDTITDFTDGEDVIHLLTKGPLDIDKLSGMMSQHDDDVWIDFGRGDVLVIENIAVKALNASDFETGLLV